MSRQWIIFFCRKILRHLVQAFFRCNSLQEIADFIIKSTLNSMLTMQLFGKPTDFEQRQVNTLGRQVVLIPKNSCENLLISIDSSPTGTYELFHIYSRGAKVPFLNIIHSKSSKGSRPLSYSHYPYCNDQKMFASWPASLLCTVFAVVHLQHTNLSHGGKTSWKSFYPTSPQAIHFCISHRSSQPSFVVLIRLWGCVITWTSNVIWV